MPPEAKARQQIDQKLALAGWLVQDQKQLNLGAALGVAVREYPTDTGPADYVLFVNRDQARRGRGRPHHPRKSDRPLCQRLAQMAAEQEIIDLLEAALSSFRDVAAGLKRQG